MGCHGDLLFLGHCEECVAWVFGTGNPFSHKSCFFVEKGLVPSGGRSHIPPNGKRKIIMFKSAKRKGICDRSLEGISNITLPETNIAPTRKLTQKETIVFQPSIFRCENVSFREGKFSFIFRVHPVQLTWKCRLESFRLTWMLVLVGFLGETGIPPCKLTLPGY